MTPRPPARLVWSVAALLASIADALDARFGACTLRGELAAFTRASSGHCYFSLKDADGAAGLLRAAMFRRAAALLDFEPGDGQLVEVRGRVALYEPRGELQFIVEAMQPVGAGALYEQFLRLKTRLEAEGLFDAQRKRALPTHPRAIGVVTSLAAAALHDVLSALARRAPHVRIVVYPSAVQGADAPAALVAALALAARRAEVDVLLVCRGGGSLQDLWAFNDERVARAIAASPLPVVCGVGHETDVTLTDLAADLRAPTPTGAAELAAPLRDELLAALGAQARRLCRVAAYRLETAQQRVDRAAARLARPGEYVQREALRLAALGRRLPRAFAAQLEAHRVALQQAAVQLVHGGRMACAQRRHREERLAALLGALDPQRVVARGYALIHAEDGALIVAPAQVRAGAELQLTLAQGHVAATIASVRRA